MTIVIALNRSKHTVEQFLQAWGLWAHDTTSLEATLALEGVPQLLLGGPLREIAVTQMRQSGWGQAM